MPRYHFIGNGQEIEVISADDNLESHRCFSMRAVLSVGAIVLTVLFPKVSHAEGLLFQLPKDGASVQFTFERTVERRNGVADTVKGSLTMSSVGKATVKGVECRWLEFTHSFPQEGRERTDVVKVLIPEKHLNAASDPLQHVVKGWVKRFDGKPEEIANPTTGFLQPFLFGELSEPQKLERTTIETTLGKLQCDGLRGIREFENRFSKMRGTYETRLHEKAPFGVISLQMELEIRSNDRVRKASMKLKLAKVQENAKSAIPDNQ